MLVIRPDASLAIVVIRIMQLPQIDYTPAILVLCIGCVTAVVFRFMEARADRRASEHTLKLLRQLDETEPSPQE